MTSQLAVTWIGTIILFGMYFLPGYIALHRLHHNVRPIFLTNLWMDRGWLAWLFDLGRFRSRSSQRSTACGRSIYLINVQRGLKPRA
jgi:hypothetical protein